MTSNLRSADIKPTRKALPWLMAVAFALAVALVVSFASPPPPGAQPVAGAAADPPAASTALIARPIDHSAVDWDALPAEPDPSPLSVAAYDH